MCCFTQAVDRVSNTSIFVRGVNGRQVIVYSMAYAARSDLAMVLPLPVPPSPPEDAVRFINLAEYPQFFVDMERAFVHEALGKKSLGPVELVELYSAPVPLVVHEVGAFEASFVPTLFPTLHVHDGAVHPGADFDHVLYCQPEPGWDHAVHLRNWSWSRGPASRFLATRPIPTWFLHDCPGRLDTARQGHRPSDLPALSARCLPIGGVHSC